MNMIEMNTKKTVRNRMCLLAIVALLVLNACAIREKPPGGPEDKKPPQIVATFPHNDSTNVQYLNEIIFEFDEAIDPASLRNQIWMMPELPNGYQTEIKKGRILKIILADSLAPNRTYIIRIGNGLKDYRGNTLIAPITLTFATGPVIDSGSISGLVRGNDLKNVFIMAYVLDDNFQDSTLFKAKPTYYTQVAQDGRYSLDYLSDGKYRLFALEDRNKNKRYDFQTDGIGFPTSDVELDSANRRIRNFNFQLTREDTLAPRLAAARAPNMHQLVLQFTEDLSEKLPKITIADSATGASLPVYGIRQQADSPNRLALFTGEQTPNSIYLGNFESACDISGNCAAGQLRFTGASKSDTTTARLVGSYPKDGDSEVPLDTTMSVFFSQPIDTVGFRENVVLLDENLQSVPGMWSFQHLHQPVFKSDSTLLPAKIYKLQIGLSGLKSVYGNAFPDTSIQITFTTFDPALTGEIGGVVQVPDSTGQAIIIAQNTQNGKNYRHIVVVNQPFVAPFVPEGHYLLRTIWDKNKNSQYDLGKSLPFQFSEPFVLYPDTIRVRKRWTTEGVEINFTE
jgi:hypothetical protein